MTTVINGSYPAVNSDSDATINGLTVGKGGGAVATSTAVGYQALNANTTGAYNVGIGYQALYTNSTGLQNVAIGYQALTLATGNENTAVGGNVLGSTTTGIYNSALGYNALQQNTTGSNNSAFGVQALYSNTTASNNTAVGYQAGYTNSTGTNNTFVGYVSGYLMTTGSKNTILGTYNGNQGGLDIRTASNYIVLSDGDGNPRLWSDGSGNITIGSGTNADVARFYIQANSATYGYAIDIKDNTAANQLFLIRNDGIFYTGTAANSPYNYTTASAANVFVSAAGVLQRSTSSLKYKTNVQDSTHGLADLLKLRPVTYQQKNLDIDGNKVETVFGGLIAEEVDAAGLTEFVQYTEDKTPDALAYGNMVSLCVKAIQELNAKLEAQAVEIATLQAK